jgi:hypothetical protein
VLRFPRDPEHSTLHGDVMRVLQGPEESAFHGFVPSTTSSAADIPLS